MMEKQKMPIAMKIMPIDLNLKMSKLMIFFASQTEVSRQ